MDLLKTLARAFFRRGIPRKSRGRIGGPNNTGTGFAAGGSGGGVFPANGIVADTIPVLADGVQIIAT